MLKIGKSVFGPREAIFLLGISGVARILLSFPRSLVEIGGPAAWLTPLGGMVAALVGIYLFSLIFKKRPGRNIMEINEDAFGSYLGTAVNILCIVLVLEVAGAIFIRQFCESIVITTLTYVPISFVEIAILAVGLLGAYLGIEALARTARFTCLFVLGGILFLIFSLLPFWDFHNLLPLLGNGPKEVFLMGTLSTAGIVEIVLAGVIVQNMGGAKNFAGIGAVFVLVGFSFLILTLLTLTLTFDWSLAEEFAFPFSRLARNVYLSRFFQRMEAIFILISGIVAALRVSLLLYGASAALAKSLKLPDYRPLIWPLGLAMFILSLLPPDVPTAINLDQIYLYSFILIPDYFLPIILLTVFWLKKWRGKGAYN